MMLNLADMSNDELVERFADICVKQDKALLSDQISKFNELYQQKSAVNAELKERGVVARLALLKLYDHPNMQVKLEAAKATLAVAPGEARQLIKFLAESNWMPQAGYAAFALEDLDTGFWKPV